MIEACSGRLLDRDAWTRLRLERGLGEFGVDYGEQDRPHEAALGFLGSVPDGDDPDARSSGEGSVHAFRSRRTPDPADEPPLG